MADKVPPTQKIQDGFSVASFGFVSMYLLETKDGFVAFDTGMKPAAVPPELTKIGVDPATVKHVFLTHTDRDHVGGLSAFPDAAIYLAEDEVPMITKKTPRFFGFVYNKPVGREYRTLSDGEQIVIGERNVKCIATPGHTSGSMSFLIDNSILVVGDELNLKDGQAVLDRGIIAIDNDKRRQSILKLAGLDNISLLCTMHSGYTRDFGHAMEQWGSI